MLAAMAWVSQVCQLLPSSGGHLRCSAQGQGIALEGLGRTQMCTRAMPTCKSQHHFLGDSRPSWWQLSLHSLAAPTLPSVPPGVYCLTALSCLRVFEHFNPTLGVWQ